MVYMGFKVGTWGCPNLASKKLKALRVIDKLVYTRYPQDSSRLRGWGKFVAPRTAPTGT